MTKSIPYILLFLIFPTLSIQAQFVHSDSINIDEVQAFYTDIFGVNEVKELENTHPLAELVNENKYFFLYLLKNWTQISEAKIKEELAKNSSTPSENYYTLLRQDTLFNSLFLPIAIQYLSTEKADFAIHQTEDSGTTVPLNQIIDIASRFFFPDGIEEDGEISAHICVGINGISDTEHGRNPYVEALSYMTINKDLLNSKYGITDSFLQAYHYMNSLDLSTNNEVKLIRAQGVMWSQMRQSEPLRTALLAELKRMKNLIPIKVTE